MEKMIDGIQFDISGYFAHFRKFYSNSSSLTYDFPPRTVIVGIIGAVLGLDKPSFPDIGISVRIISPTRKIMQKINYINTKELCESKKEKEMKKYRGQEPPKRYTQIPLEILLPEGDKIRYRIYIWKADVTIEQLKHPVYPISMGLSNFLAEINNVKSVKLEKVNSNRDVLIHSAVNTDYIDSLDFEYEKNRYGSDIMPVLLDKNRNLVLPGKYVYEVSGKPMKCILNVPYYKVYEANTNNSDLRYNGTNIVPFIVKDKT